MRICKRCHEEKPVTLFSIARARRDGRHVWCKDCMRMQANEYRHANPEQTRLRDKAHRDGQYAYDPRRAWAMVALNSARGRARKRGLPCTLVLEDILAVAGVNCPALGVPLAYQRGRLVLHRHSPTVDRIRPEQGYISGNIVVVSMHANAIKRNATQAELEAVCSFYRGLQAGALSLPVPVSMPRLPRKAKLTVAQAEEIRRLYASGGWTYESVGKRFGVSKLTIAPLIAGRTYQP